MIFLNRLTDINNMMSVNRHRTALRPKARPDQSTLLRYPKAIPQYDISTKERYASIHTIEKEYKGLHLAGNIKGGIGMADRVQQAWELAKKLIDEV